MMPVQSKPLSLADYYAAARALENSGVALLRMKPDGSGLAMTREDLWRVSVSDFFSFRKTVAKEKAKVMDDFLEAVRRAYGDKPRDLAECEVQGGRRVSVLSAKAVLGAATELDRYRGQAWVRNEEAIQRAAWDVSAAEAGPDSLLRAKPPTLSKIVANVWERLMSIECQSRVLTPDDRQMLGRRYAGPFHLPAPGGVESRVQGMSKAIEQSLRAACAAKIAASKGAPSALDPDEVLHLGQEVVWNFIVEDINQCALEHFLSHSPLALRLNDPAGAEVPASGRAATLIPERLLDLLSAMEARHVLGNAGYGLLTTEHLKAWCNRFAASVRRHASAIAAIADRRLPEHAEQIAIECCLALPANAEPVDFPRVKEAGAILAM